MIVELYDPEECDAWRVDIDVIQEFEVSNAIDEYKASDPEYTVDGFVEWLNQKGIGARRLEDEVYPLYWF